MNVAFHFDNRHIARRAKGETSFLEAVLVAARPFLSSATRIHVRTGDLLLSSMATPVEAGPNPPVTCRRFEQALCRDVRKAWFSALSDGWYSIERVSPSDVELDEVFVVSCIGMSSAEAHRTTEMLTKSERRYLFAAEFFEDNALTFDLYIDSLLGMLALESNRKAAILTIDEPGTETTLEGWLRRTGFKDISYRLYFDMDDDPHDSAQDNRTVMDIL